MTSDAKIGLLLGLVFIFIIAFIINGLPSLRQDVNNNELTTTMVSSQNRALGIGTKEREVIDRMQPAEKQPAAVQVPGPADQDIRFTAPLPEPPAVAEATAGDPGAGAGQPLPADKEQKSSKAATRALPAVYVVKDGDNLAVIAERCYGPEDGAKQANVIRIFDTNRKLLKSPHEIYPGQKLIIPALSASGGEKGKIEGVFSAAMFKKVQSIGKKHLTDGPQGQASRLYVVKDGDSLWQIAAEQLGDGSRYGEIAALNADIVKDEDNIPVGMRLKLPGQ